LTNRLHRTEGDQPINRSSTKGRPPMCKHLPLLLAAVAAVLLVAACQPIQPDAGEGGTVPAPGSVPAPAATGKVTGTVTKLDRMALPPGTVITIRLQDVSRADAPAIVLDEQVITTAGEQMPIPFALSYDPAAIDERFTYQVHVRVEVGGQLMYITKTSHNVITRGAPTEGVEVLVERV
jgi:putative lipoprotein